MVMENITKGSTVPLLKGASEVPLPERTELREHGFNSSLGKKNSSRARDTVLHFH